MKKKYHFQTFALALTVALAAPTLTGCAQAQNTNPTLAKTYKGELTGKVKWVHNSTWWFVFKADKAEPGAPSLVGPDLKVATSWVGPKKPDPAQHEFIKSLQPGQKITVKVDGRANGDLILVGAPAIAATAPKANPKSNAKMTDPNAKEGLSGYYQKLMFDELNGAPIKRWMFAKNEAATRKEFNLQKVAGAQGKVTDFKVEGQGFETATRIEITEKPKLFWHLNYTGYDNVGAEKGDLLWGVLYYRVTKAPEGAGKVQVLVSQQVGGDWKQISIHTSSPLESEEWKRYYFQTRAVGNGPVRVWNNVGSVPQTVEFGGIALVNLGPDANGATLPKNELNLNYAGREKDAAWRKEAAARIEKIRKGDFAVKVVDAAGQPVAGAEVKLEMTRHAFPFGTQSAPFEFRPGKAKYRDDKFRSTVLLDTPEGKRYRKELDELFNAAVFSPGWRVWEAKGLRPSVEELGDILLKQNKIIKMHVLLYPRSDQVLDRFKGKDIDAAQFQREHLDYVRDVMGFYKGKIRFWDVVNEPNSAVLGKNLYKPEGKYYDFLADLYKTARQTDPQAQLYLNETGTEDFKSGVPPRRYLKTLIDEIRARGGQVDGVGFQFHVGSNMTPPVEALQTLDEVSNQWNVKVAVTEFDVAVPGKQTPAIQEYQADVLRDMLYVTFSHPSASHFTMWDFWDGRHWLDNAPLFEEDWTPKPALAVWKDLLFKEWWTNAQGKAGADGTFVSRGFYGDYKVTATANGKTQSVNAKLNEDGEGVTVKLP